METQPKSILIVEDDRDIRETLSTLLELEGYRVSAAVNGHDGIQRLVAFNEPPHLILLDVMMPIKDGYEFRAEQQSLPAVAHIPVIVLTADGRAKEKAVTLSAFAGLAKPVDIDELLNTIRQALQN